MSNPQREFKLPEELAEALEHHRLSVSPTGFDAPASWYAFAFDVGGPVDEVNAFGSNPTEAVCKVIALLDPQPVSQAESSDMSVHSDASQKALNGALRRQPRLIAFGEVRDKDSVDVGPEKIPFDGQD